MYCFELVSYPVIDLKNCTILQKYEWKLTSRYNFSTEYTEQQIIKIHNKLFKKTTNVNDTNVYNISVTQY